MDSAMIFAVIAIFGGFFLVDYLLPKWRKEGQFLKSEVKPYYNKVLYYIEPYINTDFGKKLNQKAVDLLDYIYKENKRRVNPTTDDIYKLIINNSNNNDYV